MTQLYSPLNPVHSKDVNSDDVKGELVAVKNALQLVKNELEAVKGILTDGSQKVQQVGNIAIVTTIANAVSVPAGGNTGFLNLGLNGKEKRVFVMINSDQAAWTLYGRNIMNGYGKFNLFPLFDKEPGKPANTTTPYIALYLPLLTNTQSEARPTNWLEANAFIGGYTPEGAIRLDNEHSTATSTVTIRVWREL